MLHMYSINNNFYGVTSYSFMQVLVINELFCLQSLCSVLNKIARGTAEINIAVAISA